MELESPADDLKRGYDDVLNSAELATDDPVALGAFGCAVQRSLAVPACK